ncbi:hypothetical protein WA026_008089 [Henosepilachna vigintioctopunctata]|uniref:Uncharacterized protein n=1 Tax=Henosepilachna vigintioctopunctata TaxID=420089 RepID=A0AAW1TRY0_9CUCU
MSNKNRTSSLEIGGFNDGFTARATDYNRYHVHRNLRSYSHVETGLLSEQERDVHLSKTHISMGLTENTCTVPINFTIEIPKSVGSILQLEDFCTDGCVGGKIRLVWLIFIITNIQLYNESGN